MPIAGGPANLAERPPRAASEKLRKVRLQAKRRKQHNKQTDNTYLPTHLPASCLLSEERMSKGRSPAPLQVLPPTHHGSGGLAWGGPNLGSAGLAGPPGRRERHKRIPELILRPKAEY